MNGHDFNVRSDGFLWCEQEDVPSDFCSDEKKCALECVCNVADDEVRNRNYDLYLGVYGTELKRGEVSQSDVMSMALASARYEIDPD